MAEILPGKSEPPRVADIHEEISREQYKVDLTYLAKLRPLRISFMDAALIWLKTGLTHPDNLFFFARILKDYAVHLFVFVVEAWEWLVPDD